MLFLVLIYSSFKGGGFVSSWVVVDTSSSRLRAFAEAPSHSHLRYSCACKNISITRVLHSNLAVFQAGDGESQSNSADVAGCFKRCI